MIKNALLVLLVGLAISMCASCTRLEEGIVIEKSYTPAHTYRYFSTIYTGKSSVTVPKYRVIPEWYSVKVEGTVDGKVRTEDWRVLKDVYERVQIGSSLRRLD